MMCRSVGNLEAANGQDNAAAPASTHRRGDAEAGRRPHGLQRGARRDRQGSGPSTGRIASCRRCRNDEDREKQDQARSGGAERRSSARRWQTTPRPSKSTMRRPPFRPAESMNDFNTLFPNFASQCAAMNRVLLPIAFVLLVIGIVSSTVTGQRSPGAYLRTFGRTFAFLAVLSQLTIWGNQVSSIVDTTVKTTLKADPAGVFSNIRRRWRCRRAQPPAIHGGISCSTGRRSSRRSFPSCSSSWASSPVSSSSTRISFRSSFSILGYALSPIFVGFLAVRTLQSIGTSYLLGSDRRDALAARLGRRINHDAGSDRFHGRPKFSLIGGVGGAAGYTLQNLIGVAVLGVWLIFSTIAAPVILQKAIATGAQIGSALAAGAATAGVAAVTTGASTAATIGGGGGAMATAGGIAGGVVAGGAAFAGSSISGSSYSPGGGMLSSLASQRRPKQPAKG